MIVLNKIKIEYIHKNKKKQKNKKTYYKNKMNLMRRKKLEISNLKNERL